MKTYEEVAESVFEKGAGIIAERKKRRKRIAASAGMVCAALVVTVGVLALNGRTGSSSELPVAEPSESTEYSDRTGAAAVIAAGGADEGQSEPGIGTGRTGDANDAPKFGIPEDPTGALAYSYGGNSIFVNELAQEPDAAATENIALFRDDEVPMTEDELNDHYGTDVFPSSLPDGLERISDRFCVYQNDERGIYYDGNTIVYTTENARLFYKDYGYYDLSQPILNVGVSKVFGPAFSDASLTPVGDQPVRASVINGYEVFVYGYKGVNGVDWIACFQKDGVDFQIGGNNISLDDLIYVVNGYLYDTNR